MKLADYHDFSESQARGEDVENDPFWLYVYQQAFPDFLDWVDLRPDMNSQHKGRDRKVILSGGSELYTDEKLRPDKYWTDTLLEYRHVPKGDGEPWPGWIEKPLQIDYLAYAFQWPGGGACYLYPWKELQTAWNKYSAEWFKQYSDIPAENNSYVTHSLGIPNELLYHLISPILIQLGNCSIRFNPPPPTVIPKVRDEDDGGKQLPLI